MEFDDPHEVIYYYFEDDYYDNSYANNWQEFVKYIDIGIEYIESAELVDVDHYKIVDEKKWLLAKIKYGI